MSQQNQLFFSIEEYQQRLRKLREEMSSRGIEVLLSYTPENLCYITGYQTPGYYMYQCLVVPLEKEPFMVVRHLEAPNIDEYSWLQERVSYQDYEDPVEITARALRDRGLDNKVLGIEEDAWFFTIKEYSGLKEKMHKARLIDGSGCVEKLRVVKSPQELEYIRQAARIAEKGMKVGLDAIKEGVTEDDIAAAVHYELISSGSEYMSLPPFITSGYRTGIGHTTWSGRRLVKGDLLYFEIPACVKRYSAALLRTAYLGDPPDEVIKIADVINAAFRRAVETIRPGITSGEADKACRDVINQAGYGEFYKNRLGYSIGVNFPPNWGEGHILSLVANDETVLEPGMVFHVPPGVVGYKKMGLSFSDTILVAEDGCEVITNFERKLRIIQ